MQLHCPITAAASTLASTLGLKISMFAHFQSDIEYRTPSKLVLVQSQAHMHRHLPQGVNSNNAPDSDCPSICESNARLSQATLFHAPSLLYVTTLPQLQRGRCLCYDALKGPGLAAWLSYGMLHGNCSLCAPSILHEPCAVACLNTCKQQGADDHKPKLLAYAYARENGQSKPKDWHVPYNASPNEQSSVSKAASGCLAPTAYVLVCSPLHVYARSSSMSITEYIYTDPVGA